MQQVKIDAPEGFVIDVDNSDLAQGVVRFKAAPPDLGVKRRGGYFVIRGGTICEYRDCGDEADGVHRANYNYYGTRAEAEAVCRFQTAFRKLLHLANVLNPKGWKPESFNPCWFISPRNGPCQVDTLNWHGSPGILFFHSCEACQTAIDNMTTEELEALRIQQIYPRSES